MDYEKLKALLKTHDYSIARATQAIGRTEAWFHRAIKNQTMSIADLEKLLELCNTNLNDFFVNSPAIKPSTKNKKDTNEVELLREIKLLRLKIEEYNNNSFFLLQTK
jgi:hypothetical protein